MGAGLSGVLIGQHNVKFYSLRGPLIASLISLLMVSEYAGNPIIPPQINWAAMRKLAYTECAKNNMAQGFVYPAMLISISISISYWGICCSGTGWKKRRCAARRNKTTAHSWIGN